MLVFVRNNFERVRVIRTQTTLYHKNDRDVLTNLAHYFPKEGAFIWCCHLLKLQAFSYRWLELSTISFWISDSVFWFFIRWSKRADLL